MTPLLRLATWSRARNFAGSLDYIDSLDKRRGLFIKRSTARRARDAFAISRSPVLNLPFRQFPYRPNLRAPLISNFSLLGDGRAYHPAGKARPLLVTERGAANYVAPTKRQFEREEEVIRRGIEKAKRPVNVDWKKSSRKSSLSELAFSMPSKVVICAKRKIRRQILGALGVFGNLVAPPKLNLYSRIRC